MLFLQDESIGFYYVGTIPSFRKQGLASAMISLLITQYADLGLRFILQATEKGVNIYERLGFRTYRTVDLYEAELSQKTFHE